MSAASQNIPLYFGTDLTRRQAIFIYHVGFCTSLDLIWPAAAPAICILGKCYPQIIHLMSKCAIP